jgi:hypothetical protein
VVAADLNSPTANCSAWPSLKKAEALLCKAITTLAACCPLWSDDLWITDAPGALRHDGQILLADKGFDTAPATPEPQNETTATATSAASVIGHPDPQRPTRPRTTRQTHSRSVFNCGPQRLLAMACAIWHNCRSDQQTITDRL